VPRESRIIAVDGKPVSHIRIIYNHLSIYGVRIKTASLGGVCTDPEFRGRGIATRLLDYCIDEATRAGAKLLIISGDRGLYLRAQAALAGPVWETRIVHREHGDSEQALTVRAAGPDDAPALSRLHQAEPVRYLRSGDFFARMLRHGHRQPWLIESDANGRPERAELSSRATRPSADGRVMRGIKTDGADRREATPSRNTYTQITRSHPSSPAGSRYRTCRSRASGACQAAPESGRGLSTAAPAPRYSTAFPPSWRPRACRRSGCHSRHTIPR
jgi:GNAT superfamily N-acetyltransferase